MSEKIQIEDYSEAGFWGKCKKYAKTMGAELMEKVLLLYFALDSENCTAKHRSIIYGALAYLISPIDAIPDVMPGVGYTDDFGVIAAALMAVAVCIDKDVKQKAADKLEDWFG